MRNAVDTSVVVAALLGWHEQHEAAAAIMEELLQHQGKLLFPLPVLLETYAVMTRLPAPHRISPANTRDLLHANFAKTRIVAARAQTSWSFLDRIVDQSVAGGRTYDAWIVQCLRGNMPCRLYTFNARHFANWADDFLEVVVPGS